ncbi:hypothetical protein HYN59_12370 [Flavobacterium album]|uniref:Outer membrane protein beta-barrel domain-containing protein n=1 Tax=Flavobacterium album TaxID=2175091 RepID=A0A2S1QZK1_9FLAO|nr:hypothetical protein [Flavobacterium album]AWH85848.1 hypothetical protein HYN59_12370 [Flavobacterium album]
MKLHFLKALLLFYILTTNVFAQEVLTETQERYTSHNKGKFFVYWGGNRESYSKSDINFTGNGYNFTLYDVEAHDKPKGWSVDYVNPCRMTIPQTNARIGYYISDHYSIGIGLDHMKYVMTQNNSVKMNGYIDLPQDEAGSVFNGTYNNVPVVLTEDFLTFEHTDGLNFVNAGVSRIDDFSKYFGITNTDIVQLNLVEGVYGGFLYPKTNAKVLEKRRHDDFHISGFGIMAEAGINITFLKHFFIVGEFKTGYIDMPDIRTTYQGADRASQHFTYFQKMISFGGTFRL